MTAKKTKEKTAKSAVKPDYSQFLSGVINKKGETPVVRTKQQLLVWLFCKDPDSVNWSNEIKVANELFAIDNSIDFWHTLKVGFKLNTLTFFKTAKGKRIIEKAQSVSNLVLPDKKEYKFEDENVVDIKVKKETAKPKTLLDFLK